MFGDFVGGVANPYRVARRSALQAAARCTLGGAEAKGAGGDLDVPAGEEKSVDESAGIMAREGAPSRRTSHLAYRELSVGLGWGRTLGQDGR